MLNFNLDKWGNLMNEENMKITVGDLYAQVGYLHMENGKLREVIVELEKQLSATGTDETVIDKPVTAK